MLYEIRPDVFPGGYLTDLEIAVWALHFQAQDERRGR